MKKKLIIVVGLFVVSAVAFSATVLHLSKNNVSESESQSSDTKLICLSNGESITPQKSDTVKMLTELYSEAAKIKAESDVVELADMSEYATVYKNRQKLAIVSEDPSENGKAVIVNTKTSSELKKEKQTYFVFLSILEQNCADSIVWADYSYNSSYSRLPVLKLFVCTEYESLGYETAKELYDAYKSGECDAPESACYVWFDRAKITKVNDPEADMLEDISDMQPDINLVYYGITE